MSVDRVKSAAWLAIIAVCLACWAGAFYTAAAYGAGPIRAHGGRTPCATLASCRRSVAWQQKDRRHLKGELARKQQPDARYACRLGRVVYGVPVEHCLRVIGCESGGDRFQITPPYRASGLSQFLPSTWAGTVFGRAGFSIFDPVAPVLQMDAIAASQGFNTGYGWAASYGCHHLSGPEGS